MASIEKTAAGTWRARVRKAGTAKSETFRTRAEAQAWGAEQETEAVSVRRGHLPKKTLGDAIKRYKEEVIPAKRGARWELLRIGLLEREWARSDKLLADITSEDFAALRDKRLKVVGPASVIRELTILKSMFAVALAEWKWLHDSPTKGVKMPPEPEHRTRRVPPGDIEAILVAAGYDDKAPVQTSTDQTMVAFLLACETAMRSSELLAITRKHYDREKQVVYVPRSKNGAAREVPLTVRAVELLDKLPGEDRLFTISDQVRDTLFRSARDKTAVEDLHFHDTRREGTSRLAKKVDVLTLAKITGHKDLNMLMVYYQTDMSEVAAGLG